MGILASGMQIVLLRMITSHTYSVPQFVTWLCGNTYVHPAFYDLTLALLSSSTHPYESYDTHVNTKGSPFPSVSSCIHLALICYPLHRTLARTLF